MVILKDLPPEMLQCIAGKLSMQDLLAFGRACLDCSSPDSKKTYEAKSKALWLKSLMAKFSSVSTGRTYELVLPASTSIVQTLSALGWILLRDRCGEYLIFNPLSRDIIKLPALKSPDPDPIKMIALSSSPSLSRSYTVMISCHKLPGFAFLRPGENAWTEVSHAMTMLHMCTLHGLIYYDGQFVALDTEDQIMILDEGQRCMESPLYLGLYHDVGRRYLVEWSGLLLVVLTIMEGFQKPVQRIQVFKVDLQKRTKEEVNNLGNASLFLNGNSSFSVEFNAESCYPGIKPDHVYFLDIVDGNIKTYGMKDGIIETCFNAAKSDDYNINEAELVQPDFYRDDFEKMFEWFSSCSV